MCPAGDGGSSGVDHNGRLVKGLTAERLWIWNCVVENYHRSIESDDINENEWEDGARFAHEGLDHWSRENGLVLLASDKALVASDKAHVERIGSSPERKSHRAPPSLTG